MLPVDIDHHLGETFPFTSKVHHLEWTYMIQAAFSCTPKWFKGCVSHREPAADVSDEEEAIVLEVAHHGVAATQLCGPAIPLVVVADGAIPHHCQDKGEDPLVVTGGKAEREQGILARVNPH